MTIKFLKAHDGDSILLSFKDSSDTSRNILIDGGRAKTYFGSGKHGDLYHTIKGVRAINEKIDLLILTHIDSDHIGGLKKWFEKDKDAFDLVKKVWFNSGRSIAKYFEQPENPELTETINIFETTKTSVNQAKIFEDYIEQFEVWDKKIVKNESGVISQNGAEIIILSPDNHALEKLLKKYKKPQDDYKTSGTKKDWHKSIESFINEESDINYKFEEDKGVANGSSIAFLLAFKNKNYLLLGDAHPSIIISSLKHNGYSKEKPVKVEFLKVSHHGSCRNTSKELLELIKTNNYIISTDGGIHGLPNKRTIARIINHNSNAIFHFNYKHVMDYIFVPEDSEYISFDQKKVITEWT